MPVSTRPPQPPEPSEPTEPAAQTTAAAAAPTPAVRTEQPAGQPAADSGRYPLRMVKGGAERLAHHQADETRLSFEGWRPADQTEPARGEFLPRPRQAAPASTTTMTTRRKA